MRNLLSTCLVLIVVSAQSQSFKLTDSTFTVGDTLVELIVFDYNEAIIPETSFPFLDSLSDVLFFNTNLKLEVGNFMDFRGVDTYNFKLTKLRAQAIVNYLISKGISASRLVPIGYGERKQVYAEQKIASEKVLEFKNKMLLASQRTEFKIMSISLK